MGATILITGATGYIGGRLLRSLEKGGYAVRCLARHPEKVVAGRKATEVVQGDCLDEVSLDAGFRGVHTAYYLVHSMAAGSHFAELDRRAAENFGRAAARAGVERIVYLGGLADDLDSLSAHLTSRAETGAALRLGGVPVVEFRASIVIGAGSLSFEMIRALVERLPLMVCPRWVATLTQPIAVDDVVAYLTAALDLPDGCGSRVFEIGGPEVVSYGDLMREYARLRGLRRLMLPVPVLSPHLSGLWLALVTPAQARVGRALVEGLKNTSVVTSNEARDTFPIKPMPLRAAFVKAIDDGAAAGRKIDIRTVVVNVPPSRAFAPVRRVGGVTGWYFGNLLWSARGRVDRLLGGVGMNRARRDPERCVVGDIIDGWTVDAYEPDRRLRLSADLLLPGRGWLEFEVMPLDASRRSMIRQTATFDPRGVLGRAYWYAILPIHALIFRGLLKRIAQHAEAGVSRRALSLHRPFDRFGGAAATLAIQALERDTPSPTHSKGEVGKSSMAVIFLAALTTTMLGQPSHAVRTVETVDLDRYLGDWYEIARFPNSFQRACASDVRASYGRRADGHVLVMNRCRRADGGIVEAKGDAKIVDSRTSAKLKVRFAPAVLSFLPFVWGDYWILGLSDDYSWAVVGSPNRDYLWILARTPVLGAESYASAVAVARANEFDVDRLVMTRHSGPAEPRPR